MEEAQLHLFLTFVLDGGEFLTARPGRYPENEPRYPLLWRPGRAQSQAGRRV
jgi:hypothetical protein